MNATFPVRVVMDRQERCFRFLEEAAELTQALGFTEADAQRVIAYVFARQKGEPKQELGGVMITLYALANAIDLNVLECGIRELERCWEKRVEIADKQTRKPIRSSSAYPHA